MSSSNNNNNSVVVPTLCLSLIIVRHPTTGKFLLVHETQNRGWWLPGGKVESGQGETFEAAAHRECMEEAGLRIVLRGIIRVEHSIVRDFARMRVIFFAEPMDLDQAPKSVADKESIEARWVSVEEVENGQFRLRGSEPLECFRYIHNGNHVCPMSFFTREGAPLLLRNAPTSAPAFVKSTTPSVEKAKANEEDNDDDDENSDDDDDGGLFEY